MPIHTRETRDLLKSFDWGIAALHRLDAATKLPCLAARPIASISSAPAKGLFGALPIGDGGTKGGATCRFKAETAMLAEWLPQPFPSRRDREFESVFLQ